MIYAIVLLMICDPSLAALFTPPRPEIGRYEVCTGPQTIEAALADEGAPGAHVTIDALEPLDAFGRAGPYDRAALARLYGGNRVQVARRWRQRGDEFIAETLLSPYPDAALSRLHPGTMAIRWIVTRR